MIQNSIIKKNKKKINIALKKKKNLHLSNYLIPKYFDYNRLGKKYYNIVKNKPNNLFDKGYQYYTKKFNINTKFTLQPKKNNINFKKIKKFQFYLRQNFHSIFEKGKVDYLKDYTLNYNKYQKNTFYSKFIKNNLFYKSFIKKKKNQKKYFSLNYLYFNSLNNNKKFLINFIQKKDYLNLIKFKKKFLKNIKKNYYFFKNLNIILPFKIKQSKQLFLLNSISNTKLNFTNINCFDFKKNNIIYNNILNKTSIMNKNEFNFFVTKNSINNNNNNLFNFKNLILKFYTKIITFITSFFDYRTIPNNYAINLLASNKLFYAIATFCSDILFNKFDNLDLLNLNNLFFISKKVTNFNFLFFENKNFLTRIKQNYIRRIQNLNLKLLQQLFPDNVFDIPKTIEKPLIIKLINNGNKNYNNGISYLNFQKNNNNNLFLTKKKNLFYFKNDYNFNYNQNYISYYNRKAISVRKVRNYFKSMDYLYLSNHSFFGINFYKRYKKRYFAKKKQFRNLLSFLKFKRKTKQRRQHFFLELNLIKNLEIMKVDFS